MHDRFNHLFGGDTHYATPTMQDTMMLDAQATERGSGGLGHYNYPVYDQPRPETTQEREKQHDEVALAPGQCAVRKSTQVG